MKLNLGQLEAYLLEIKSQLSRHEDELVHPVWWNSMVRQIDQIYMLKKKMEHQGGDINSLRELVLQSAQSGGGGVGAGGGEGPGGLSAVEKAKARALHQQVGLLEADVETLKLLVRKIDLSSATESLMMSQIRELQRYLRSTTKLVNDRAPDGALTALKQVVQTVETIVPDVDQRLTDSEESLRQFVEARIPVVSDEVSLRVYREERAKEIEFVPKKEYMSKVAGIAKQIEEVHLKMESMNVNAALKSTIAGKKSLNDAVKKRLKQRERDLFDRWIQFTKFMRQKDEMERLKDFRTFWPRFKSYVESLAYKTYFQKWCKRVSTLRTWDLYKHRLKKSILFWRDKACPDVKKYLLKWKATVVTMRIPEYNPNSEEGGEEGDIVVEEEKSEKVLEVEETQEMIEVVESLEDATKEGKRAEKTIEIIGKTAAGGSPGTGTRSSSPTAPKMASRRSPSPPSASPSRRMSARSPSPARGGGRPQSAKPIPAAPSSSPSMARQRSVSFTSLKSPSSSRKHKQSFRDANQVRQLTSATATDGGDNPSAVALLNTLNDDLGDYIDPDSLEYLANTTVAHLDDIPDEHLEQKIGLIGQFVRHSSTHIDASLADLEDMKGALDALGESIERKAEESRRWTDSQCGAVASNLQKWSNRSTMGLRDVTTGLTEFKQHTNEEIERMEERLDKLTKGLNEQKRVSKELSESIDGVKLLQGDLLEKNRKIEERMSTLEASYGECIANSDAAIQKAKYAEDLVEQSKKRLDDGLEYFDSEFSAAKKAAKLTNRLVNQTTTKLETFQIEVRANEKKLLDRTDELEDLVKSTYQGVALPDELAEICFRLEDKVMNEPGASVADLFRDDKYNQMLSNFCLRLARQIHDAAHTRMMEKIIAGVRVKPSVSPSKTAMGTGAKFGPDLFVSDETAIEEEQKALLEAFSEEFVRLLRDRESRPGYVRAQTRVVLHSRFTAALEMALGEMNSRDKKPYMNTIPSEFLNGMNIATSAWGDDDENNQTFPSPTKFETRLLPDHPASPVSNHDEEDSYMLSNTTGILGPRTKSAPGIISTGEDISSLYPREASIPSLRRVPGNMSDTSGGDAFVSRKLTASGKLDPFLASVPDARSN